MSYYQKIIALKEKYFIISRSLIVIFSSLFASFFSYLTQVLAGRYFDIVDYGIFVSLTALSALITLVILPFTSGIPKLVAEIKDINYPQTVSELFYTIFKIQLILSFIMFLGIELLAHPIASYINIENIQLIRIFGIYLLIFMSFAFITPFLQGLMRFKAYSFLSILYTLVRFGAVVIVMLFTLSVANSIEIMTVGIIFCGITGLLLIKKNINKEYKSFSKEYLLKLLKYSIGSLFAVLGISLLTNNDVVLAKHFFTPELAGLYGSVSIIGKMAYYAAIPVSVVMLPIISQKYKNNQNVLKPFLLFLAMGITITSVITLLFVFIPDLMIKLMFGIKYIGATQYLWLFGIYMITLIIFALTSWFLIGISEFKTASIILGSAILQILGIYAFHRDIYDIIYISIYALTGGLLFTYVLMFKKKIISKEALVKD